MPIIQYFDECALLLCVFLIFSTVYRGLMRNRAGKLFLVLLGCIAVSAAFDIVSVYTENHEGCSLILKHIAKAGYVLFHALTPPVYMIFIIAMSDTVHLIKKHKILLGIFVTCLLVEVVSIAVTPFTGFVYLFDEAGKYHRGIGMVITYAGSALFLLGTVIHLIKYRKLYTRIKFISLIIIVPLILAAIGVQLFYRALRIEIFASTIAAIFISTFVNRSEERIDITTKLNSFEAYSIDMRCSFRNGKEMDVILVNVSNFRTLQEILNYDGAMELKRLIAERLMVINKRLKLNADLYYLDRGRFRLVIERTETSVVEHAADAVNAALKPKVPLYGMELNLIACVCVAKCPEDISDFDSIIAFGKDLGTKYPYTGLVTHASTLFDQARYDVIKDLDFIIENAIAKNNFKVYYQPIYSVAEQRFVSAEALLRLIDDKYGFISPELFIPVAEKSGAIHKIGAFVLEEVCRFIASDEFESLGLEYIEVNLSVVQCMQSSLADEVLDLLEKYHIPSDKINLEITETAVSQSQNIFADNLSKLVDAGISFSLDDYGTGYSNVKRMASLPLKIVKLDKTFTNFDNNPKLLIILRNTVKMIKDMGIEIVVEGIETEKMVECFSEMECDFIQGFYYSKPIPREDFVTFLLNHIGSKCKVPDELP